MRYLLLFWFTCSVVAQPVVSIVRGPERGHRGVAAYWINPTNQIFVAEWSTNLVNWTRASNETVYMDGLRFSEADTGLGQWFVRLRLYVEPPPWPGLTKL